MILSKPELIPQTEEEKRKLLEENIKNDANLLKENSKLLGGIFQDAILIYKNFSGLTVHPFGPFLLIFFLFYIIFSCFAPFFLILKSFFTIIKNLLLSFSYSWGKVTKKNLALTLDEMIEILKGKRPYREDFIPTLLFYASNDDDYKKYFVQLPLVSSKNQKFTLDKNSIFVAQDLALLVIWSIFKVQGSSIQYSCEEALEMAPTDLKTLNPKDTVNLYTMIGASYLKRYNCWNKMYAIFLFSKVEPKLKQYFEIIYQES